MGFRTGAYAKVWSVEPKSDTNTVIRISISRKNRESGEYEQEFSGFVACIGTAAAKSAANLKEGARIRLGDVDVTTYYHPDRKVTYTNYKCFSFEVEDEGASNTKTTPDELIVDEVDEEDALPF